MQLSNDHYLLTRIEVGSEIRGKGFARQLLTMVLSDADREGVTILLSVEPDGTGLTFQQLCDFYTKRGFEPLTEMGRSAMIRKPHGDSQTGT